MTVRRKIRNYGAVLLSAGALVACSKLLWMVKYQDQDPYYSRGNVTTVDSAGNAYVAGYVETRPEAGDLRIPFVAKYDVKGNLLWDKKFYDGNDTSLIGVRGVLADNAGNLYVAEYRRSEEHPDIGLQITKLNAAGEQLWQWYDYMGFGLSVKTPLYIGKDGNLYAPNGSGLLSLTPDGVFRWFETAADVGGIGEEVDLEPFPFLAQAFAFDDNFVSVTSSFKLRIIDLQGNDIAGFTAEQLGLTIISESFSATDYVVVFGATATDRAVIRLIRKTVDGFVPDNEKTLVLSSTETPAFITMHPENGFCYAWRNNQSVVTTGFFDSELNRKWQNTRATSHAEFTAELTSVVGAGDACYTQYAESHASDKLSAVVVIENIQTGKLEEILNIDHFGVSDLAVSGKNVFQAGITGSYTTLEGTAATMTKHYVY